MVATIIVWEEIESLGRIFVVHDEVIHCLPIESHDDITVGLITIRHTVHHHSDVYIALEREHYTGDRVGGVLNEG